MWVVYVTFNLVNFQFDYKHHDMYINDWWWKWNIHLGYSLWCCMLHFFEAINACFAGGIANLSPSLWHFGHLTKLYLRNNQLVSLPADIAHLSHLVHLDVSNNKLHSLPPELGDIVSLKELLLSHNRLVHLPYELGKLFQLQKLGQICLLYFVCHNCLWNKP